MEARKGGAFTSFKAESFSDHGGDWCVFFLLSDHKKSGDLPLKKNGCDFFF